MGTFLSMPEGSLDAMGGVPLDRYLPSTGVPGYDAHFSASDLPGTSGTIVADDWPDRFDAYMLEKGSGVVTQGNPANGHKYLSFGGPGSNFNGNDSALASGPRTFALAVRLAQSLPVWGCAFGGFVLGATSGNGWSIATRDGGAVPESVEVATNAVPENGDYWALVATTDDYGSECSVSLGVQKPGSEPTVVSGTGSRGSTYPIALFGRVYGPTNLMLIAEVWSWPRVLDSTEIETALASISGEFTPPA